MCAPRASKEASKQARAHARTRTVCGGQRRRPLSALADGIRPSPVLPQLRPPNTHTRAHTHTHCSPPPPPFFKIPPCGGGRQRGWLPGRRSGWRAERWGRVLRAERGDWGGGVQSRLPTASRQWSTSTQGMAESEAAAAARGARSCRGIKSSRWGCVSVCVGGGRGWSQVGLLGGVRAGRRRRHARRRAARHHLPGPPPRKKKILSIPARTRARACKRVPERGPAQMPARAGLRPCGDVRAPSHRGGCAGARALPSRGRVCARTIALRCVCACVRVCVCACARAGGNGGARRW